MIGAGLMPIPPLLADALADHDAESRLGWQMLLHWMSQPNQHRAREFHRRPAVDARHLHTRQKRRTRESGEPAEDSRGGTNEPTGGPGPRATRRNHARPAGDAGHALTRSRKHRPGYTPGYIGAGDFGGFWGTDGHFAAGATLGDRNEEAPGNPGASSGEGGKLSPPSPQVHARKLFRTKLPFRRSLTIIALIAVVCGCLVSPGSIFSTNPAHPDWTGVRVGAVRPSHSRRRSPELPQEHIAASYSRYSSDLQDESSIEQQQRKCRERATADGVPLVPEFEFSDRAVSGTKSVREGLTAMLEAARDRRFQVLYFESLSRLARESVITMPMLKELVYVHRVRIVSVTEGIDSSQSNWDLIASFMSWVHEQYLKALRSAVLRGQEQCVLNDWSTGDWCFGYGSEPIPGTESGRRGRNARPRMRVVVNHDHAAWVVRIFTWFVGEGWSLDRIARELTRLGAPKDHRSTTKGWHHEYVRRVLRNEKYVGVWAWGKATNVRNPLTGAIAQEGRPPGEVAKWIRHRPDLRLVEDDLFLRAQGLLDQLEAKWSASRTDKGRLRGSAGGAAPPRHLLQGLIKCSGCGSTFQVNGANGKYLGCAGYKRGLCGCKTRLPRKLAEEQLLAAVGERVLADPAWLDAVVAEAQRAWAEGRKQDPDERVALDRELAAVDQKISRLLDLIESGEGSHPELVERLAQRRRERRDLELRAVRLNREAPGSDEPPTRDWIKVKLSELGATMTAGGPDAARALGDLVTSVTVKVAPTEGRKRPHLVGTFQLVTAAVLGAAGAREPGSGSVSTKTEEVTVHFRPVPPWARVADEAKALFDAGADYRGIAQSVRCPAHWVSKALAWWYREHGQPSPDGRSLKARLATPSRADRLADEAKVLWDAGTPIQEIASRLGCNRDTVTSALRSWFGSRGMSVPDGRHRRKEVREQRDREQQGD